MSSHKSRKSINKEIFAGNLRKLLGAFRLNQSEFAERIGASQPVVSDWLNAKHLPTRSALEVIYREFSVTERQLIEGSEALDAWTAPSKSLGPLDPRGAAIRETQTTYGQMTPSQQSIVRDVEKLLTKGTSETEGKLRFAIDFIKKSEQ